ncbi:MAG: acetylesterase [Anaerolineae bacterium]|nr:acetylesterase [Anaerolineae bacterium]
MPEEYQHLGVYSDWVAAARQQRALWPKAKPGRETQARVREVLGFCSQPETLPEVRVEGQWERDGLRGEALSWSVGYGPRTQAWLLQPAAASGPLPGVVALHDHGGFKFYGKAKIADGPGDVAPVLRQYRETYYGCRAYANALAREGFAVLIHDTFLWGSRRFPLTVMPDPVLNGARATVQFQPEGIPPEIALYNRAAADHEHVVEKYCNLLGTTLAGVVSHEDRIAVEVLRSRPEVAPDRLGCIGLSGGGNRAALLQATCDWLSAAVIVGLMSTYEALLDHNMSHTWMFFPSGWSRYGDWPDLAACRAPSPLLVQYDLEDQLFTEEGMRAADRALAAHYAAVGAPDAYEGQFYPGPHKFDLEMQGAAFAWLKRQLCP